MQVYLHIHLLTELTRQQRKSSNYKTQAIPKFITIIKEITNLFVSCVDFPDKSQQLGCAGFDLKTI